MSPTERLGELIAMKVSGPVGRESRCRPSWPPAAMVAGPVTEMLVKAWFAGSAVTNSTPLAPMFRLEAWMALALSSSSTPLFTFSDMTPDEVRAPT